MSATATPPVSEPLAEGPASARNAGLAALATTLAFLGGTLPTPLYGIYQAELGWSTFTATAVYAAYAVGTIGALAAFGRASDQMGRRVVLLAGLAIGAISALLFSLAHALVPILLARVLSGVSVGILAAVTLATLAELSPRGRLIGSRSGSIAQMVGLGCGPLLAGALAQWVGEPLRVPYWAHIVLLAIAAALVWRLPETVSRHAGATLAPQRIAVPPQARAAFLRVAPGVFGAIAVQGFFAALSSSFLRGELGIDEPVVIGIVGSLAFFGTSVGALFVARLGNERSLRVGSVFLLVGLALAAVAVVTETLAATCAAAILGGLAIGLTFAAAVGEVNGAAPEDRRAEANAALLVVLYSAISLPVLGVGVLAQLSDLQTAIEIFLGVITAIALVSLVLVRRELER